MRTLTVMFHRDAARDRQAGPVQIDGYRTFCPDGREAVVSLSAFCRHGQRVLGMDRHLIDLPERLVDTRGYASSTLASG